MSDSQHFKDLQNQLNKFISRLDELEIENRYLKEQQMSTQCQLIQNVKIMDAKYSKMYRKYLKCLYKYGIYQSCLTNMILQYNKLIEKQAMDLPKMDMQFCIEKYGIIYENNKIIDEQQMDEIICKRIKKESEEIQTLFFPTKIWKSDCLSESDSLYKFQNNVSIQQQSQRLKMQGTMQHNSELITEHSEDTTIANLTTQRYLDKLSFDYSNDQTLQYPKTFKVDKLLQQSNRDTQMITDRQRRQRVDSRGENRHEAKIEQIKVSPIKQLNQSINEDRLKRFDQENEHNQPRRRSRAERLKQQQ